MFWKPSRFRKEFVIARIAAASFFCFGLKKAVAKKDTAESRIKLLKKDFGETVLSLKYCAIKNPKILRLRVLIFQYTGHSMSVPNHEASPLQKAILLMYAD